MSDLVIQHCPLETENIPEGWELVSLSDFVDDIQTGFASGQHNRDGEGVPHLRPMNVSPRGTIDMDDLRYVAPDKNPLRLRRGDVLFNNTNSPAWVGKTAYIDTDDELAFSNHMTRLRAPEDVDPHYLAHQLQFLCTSGYFQHQCKKHVNQASINRSFLGESTPFLLPPTAEQPRIVGKIEALQERSRNAREALAEVGPLLEQFRQSLLAAAFRGDLTADWRAANPNVEPATELLNRIRQERREKWEQAELAKYEAKGKQPPKGWKDKYTEPDPIDHSELPELPDGWCWTSFGEAFEVYVGATPSRKEPGYWNGNISWVSSGEVGFCRIRETKETITELGLSNTSTSVHAPGTVLLGMIGEGKTRGQAAILDIAACHNQNSAAIRVADTPIPSEYIYQYLRFVYEITRRVGSGNNQPALNKSRVQGMTFPLAPLEEQFRICEEISELLAGATEINEIAEDSHADLAKLDQSILAKAFRGELVPQDPNDEPAYVLLERIREARETEKANKKRKGGRKGTPKKAAEESSASSATASLLDVLRKAGMRLHVDDLQAASGLSSTRFYSQLKDAIASGAIKEELDDDNRYLVPAK